MDTKIELKAFNIPRKENNDLGDFKCDMCGKKSSVYLRIIIYKHTAYFCKGCLLSGISMIDKAILDKRNK